MRAIKIKNLSKSFMINSVSSRSLKYTLLNVFVGTRQKLTVLDDISFDIKKGEFIGIIGQNGCGKSTLLKILAGIIEPDTGKIEINGKVSPFLELGVGFQEELSALDNIYLYGSLLGMTKSQIDEKLNDIISFSELEKFINTPLKHFSSGMYVRLAFSVAIHADFDILLLDEVLAVGDYSFQQKCLQKFKDFKQNCKTVIYVSHDMHSITNVCERCLWLESGKIKKIGSSKNIVDNYLANEVNGNNSQTKKHISTHDKRVFLEGITLNNTNKQKIIHAGDKIQIKIRLKLNLELENPIIGINIYNHIGNCVYAINTAYQQIQTGMLIKGQHQVQFEIEQYLAHGDYSISLAICDHTKTKVYLQLDNTLTFKVINKSYFPEGLTDFPAKITIR